MDCSTPGFPVLHYLPEFAQTRVHWVGDAIQPSHPLLPPSPPALSLSQHQSFSMSWLFASGGQSIGASASASVLPVNIQSWFPLGLTGLISLLSKGLSRVLSSTTVQKHQFFSAQPFLWSNSHIHMWLREKPLDNVLHVFSLCLGLCPNLSSSFLCWAYLDCIIQRDGKGGRRLMFSFLFCFDLYGVPAGSRPTLPDTFTNVWLFSCIDVKNEAQRG